ncbi:hypothetical protein TrRE_jg9889 [Triparma retinervis]|uniref:GPR180/TMEM145 transmembrane domain-containing protein n=1 Tax=Triparma retinervis TaxID=2557542 RepID=A0A9W7F9N0_9STRA|nr:hypothetical protein TrRE_jg9889 [Triparma retinervis]
MLSPPLFTAFVLLLSVAPSIAYQISGSVDSLEPWTFIDRFCFVPHELELEVGQGADIDEARNYGLFQWSFAFPEDMDLYLQSCSERSYYSAKNFRLSTQYNTQKIVTRSEKNMVTSGFAYFKTSHPKFFFVAVSNCDPACSCNKQLWETEGNSDECVPASTASFCDGPLVFDYTFEFTNGITSSTKHFGYDELGLLQISWTFSVFYLLLVFFINKMVRGALIASNKYHVTVKIMVYSTWMVALGVGCNAYHYMTYSKDGIGASEIETLGKFLFSLGEILLVLHLILIAKGWTIVRRKISANGRMKIGLYTTIFAFLHVTTRYYSRQYMDRGSILYEFETPPGLLLRGGRIFAALWFLYSVRTTMNQFPRQKRRFYRNFSSVFGLWFFWQVILTYLPDGIPDYMRFKFAMAFELCMFFTAQFVLAMMYSPTISKTFPFHSNAAHEIMTGKFSEDAFRREIGGSNRRRQQDKKRSYKFTDDSSQRPGGTPGALLSRTTTSNVGDPASSSEANQLGHMESTTPSPTPASPLTALFAGREIPVQPQYAFSSVAEASAAVRVAGDDVSEVLHILSSNLETLDDAMDDWDEDIGGEDGEAYDEGETY